MKKGFKIFLDIIMTIGILCLMSTVTTGIAIHELLGIGVSLLFLLHKILNWNWIRSITKIIFTSSKTQKANTKTKIMYMLDAAILLFIMAATITGIGISTVVFPVLSEGNSNYGQWASLHASFSYISLILISIHLGFHWKYLLYSFRKMFNVREENKTRTFVVRLTATLLVLAGIKFSAGKQIGETIILPFQPLKNQGAETTIQSLDTIMADSPTYTAVQTTAADETTLEEYLGNLICTACHRRCSLLSPRCGKGVRKAQSAASDYETMIAEAVTSSEASSEVSTAESSDAAAADDLQDSALSFIPVMSVYIAGTHYLVTLADKRKQKASETRGIGKN